MKSLSLLSGLVFVFLVSSCTAPRTYGIYAWENSNARLIEKSVPASAVVHLVDSVLTDLDRLVVLSEETSLSTDRPILTGIEAQIERGLLAANVTVLERDHDLIARIIAESEDHYRVLSEEKYRHSGAAASQVSGSSSGSASSNYSYVASSGGSYRSSVSGGSGQVSYSVENWSRLDSTNLLAATKILSYRVLECGIQKQVEKSGYDGYPAKEVGRLARTVLDIKLIDAATGEIMLSERVSGSERYRPEEGDVETGVDPQYRYYSFGSPLQNGNPELQKISEDEEPESPPKKPLLGFLPLVVLVIAAVAL